MKKLLVLLFLLTGAAQAAVTVGNIPKFVAGARVADSQITDNGTTVGIPGALSVTGAGDFAGYLSADVGIGVGATTGIAGLTFANGSGQLFTAFIGDLLNANALYAGFSVLQSTKPMHFVVEPSLSTAAMTLDGIQAAFGLNAVVGSYSVATTSGVVVGGAGSNSLVQGNMSVGGTMAATTLTGNGAGITNLSVSNVSAGTLAIAAGGTASGTAMSGSSIMVSNGSAIVQGAAGTATTLLHGNASGAPTYSQVSLSADVTGSLSGSNVSGGTFGAVNGSALTALTAANVTGSNTLPDGVLSTNVPLKNGTNAYTGLNTFPAGTGGAAYPAGGILDHLIISSGMAAGVATETTLYSYNLPANTFLSTATLTRQVLYIMAGGTTGAATLERVRIYFGGTTCADSGNVGLNGTSWKAECWISQKGTGATQAGTGSFIGGTATLTNTDTLPTETISGTINIKITGTVQVATADGVLVRHAYVKKE